MMPDLIKLITAHRPEGQLPCVNINNNTKVTQYNIMLTWKSEISHYHGYEKVQTQSYILNPLYIFPLCPLSSRHLGRMSVRGLDPTCPSSIKREPSSPSPSSQGDVSPAQPSPGSSSSDTNSSYGHLTKGHGLSNGLDSPGLYGHPAALANNGATNRLVYASWRTWFYVAPNFWSLKRSCFNIWVYSSLFPSFFLSTHIQEVWGGRRTSEVWIHAGLGGQTAVSGVRWRGLRVPLRCRLLWGLQGLLQEDHPG